MLLPLVRKDKGKRIKDKKDEQEFRFLDYPLSLILYPSGR
jgi:hypothetical protein